MNKAIIFPGQGSQKIGMGRDVAYAYPAAKQVFEEVDDALKMKLSHIIWDGNLEDLTLTENAQPALMANSMAILAALETEGINIKSYDFVAGHSLGEYSALCAAKAISLGDSAKLLRRRGIAMQSCVKAGEGTMAAILGLSANQITEVLNEFEGPGICQIANDNDPNQVVISGHCIAVSEVIELAKKKGARRALPLNVSAPFHCKLMAPAAEIMKETLASIKIIKPRVPIIMNTRAEVVVEPEQIREFLVDQIIETVRWRETIAYIYDHGVSAFYEIGSGKVLSGMVKRVVGDSKTVSISSYKDILELIEDENIENVK